MKANSTLVQNGEMEEESTEDQVSIEANEEVVEENQNLEEADQEED